MSTGCFNPKADEMMSRAEPKTWSDTNLDRKDFESGPGADGPFKKLVCTCGCESFQVAQTGYYETSARCTACYKWFIVHSG